MSLAMNERSPSSMRRDIFRAHTPTTNRHRARLRATNGGMSGDRFHRDWFAQRAWEDDGGQVSRESMLVAATQNERDRSSPQVWRCDETERRDDMRRDYKFVYHAAPIPIVRPTAEYDPIRTYVSRRATAARRTRRTVKVRLARMAEFWIELIVPSMLALVMLPVLWVVGIIMLARALWRRYAQRRRSAADQRQSIARPWPRAAGYSCS